jgi:hypothetical protein
MRIRASRLATALFYVGLSTSPLVNSCSNKHLVSIAVTPQNASVSQTGQITQFEAIGTTSDSRVSPESLTSEVTWSSSTPSVATISATGVATTVGCGETTINAQDGSIVGQSTLTNTCLSLQSITVLPSNPTVPQIGQTTQFLALGSLVGGGQEDLTATATWSSSNIAIANFTTTGQPGLATAIGCGASTISAQFQPTGSVPVAGSTLLTVSCGTVIPIELLVTKNGNAAGTVTSTPAGINCGPVCGGSFNEGTGFMLAGSPNSPIPAWGSGCDQVIQNVCYFTLMPDVPGGTQKVVNVSF